MSRQSSIAWFKLAELVQRGERERVFSLLRLMSYSLPDTAIRAQLEGDLLTVFHDRRALDCYTNAALLYEKTGRNIYAELIRERLKQSAP